MAHEDDAATTGDALSDTVYVPPHEALSGPLTARSFRQRYEQEVELGKGGMGTVVLCHDLEIGRRVAMKQLHGNIDVPEARTRFAWEARVQGQLEHPSVVPVYDLGIDPDGRQYFTMKRVRGVTLADILRGRVSDERSERYGRRRLLAALASVCLAIDYAHQHQVVHRDLKPANIMLGDFGEVYVLDWGLAKTRVPDVPSTNDSISGAPGDATAHGALLGTPGYMAPEQVRGDEVGPAADIYALGAILFEILTGEPLHDRSSPRTLLDSTSLGADARPSARRPDRRCPPELDAVCVRATALDPAVRFASARDLHDRIEAYLDGERDEELRRALSRRHGETAEKAASQARAGDDDALSHRRTALHELGQALVLDPSNHQAVETFLALVATPPDALPPEVVDDLRRNEQAQNRWTGKVGALAYASLVLYLPVLLWCGIAEPLAIIVFYGLALITTGVSLYVVMRDDRTALLFAVLVLSTATMATTTSFFGPLVLSPALVAVNTAAFIVHLGHRYRLLASLIGALGVLVPIALELTGITPTSYQFTAEGMLIVPHAIGISRLSTWVLLSMSSLAIVVTTSAAMGQVRDTLGDAERRLYLYAWHIRQFLPELGRGGDPR